MNKQKKQQNFQSDNFFEAFRDLGNQAVKTGRDAAAGIAGDMARQVLPGSGIGSMSGELKPNQPLSFEQEFQRREEEARRKEFAHLEYARRQEMLVFSRKQEEIKTQIEAIQEELKKLVGEAVGLAQEVEMAVEQSIVDPGVYHLNFFDKLRQTLILLRKKVADSHTWMHTVNSRSKQRSFFWAQVGQSGTKFMLSQERYMSTQAG
ncbi:MAG TPA: DUF5660 family protein [Patescibacteria group bacterium]|nr:DUF5660 family protein [Patescibacteria group bacterium]